MKLGRIILTLVLTALMAVNSTGMTLNLHFCANNLQKVSINAHDENCMQRKPSKNLASSCDTEHQLKKESSCCKDKQIAAKNPVKIDSKKSDEKHSFLKSLIFVKSYITSFFVHETEQEENDEKPDISLFPLLKEGLYILLGQFRN